MKPTLLDAFSGAGGCARGYQLAGFEVTGVDIRPQPRYAGDHFVQGDALEFIREHGREFDVIHASPPCQSYTALRAMHQGKEYPDLLAATRGALQATRMPWIMENVPGAAIENGVILCGSMFGLETDCRDGLVHQLRRHRHFESNVMLLSPPCNHRGRPVGVYGNGGGSAGRGYLPGINGFTGNGAERRRVMGIDWMNRAELSQAIPPAYTEYLGRQLIAALSLEAAS